RGTAARGSTRPGQLYVLGGSDSAGRYNASTGGVPGRPTRTRRSGGRVTYRFGRFTLDTRTRQLLDDDNEVHLSPKAFELLQVLVRNRDRAMSRSELHEHLWPSTFVLETNLASLVAEIRRALGD